MAQKGMKKNVILSTMYQLIKMIVPLIIAPYTARVLGVKCIGVYSFTSSISAYFTLFAALGTESYGLREIARCRDDYEKRNQCFWEICILTAITSLACIVLWVLWIFISEDNKTYYIILTISLLSVMFDISWFYGGLEEFKFSIYQNIFFKSLGTIAIFIFVNSPSDLWVYFLINMLMCFCANVSMWMFLPRFVSKPRIKLVNIKKHFKETLVYFVPTIAISIYTVLDKTLIGLITSDTRENGNYEEATRIVRMASVISFSGLNTVVQSRVSYLFKEKKYTEIKNHIDNSMNYLLFMGIGLSFGMISVADRFVPLYFGDGFSETINLLRVLSPLVVIIGISNCIGSQYYNPAGLRAKSAKYIMVGACVNFFLNICLIPYLKSLGAAIGTIVAELIITILYLCNCNTFYSISKLRSQIWKKLISGVIMLIIEINVGNCLTVTIFSLMFQIMLGVIIYISLLYLFKDSFVIDCIVPIIKRKRYKGEKKN